MIEDSLPLHRTSAPQARDAMTPARRIYDLVGKVTASRLDTKQFITAQTFASAENGIGGNFATAIAKQNLVAVTVNVGVGFDLL